MDSLRIGTAQKRRAILQVAVALSLVTLLLVPAVAVAQPAMHHTATATNQAIMFQSAMRELWEDHITWTRMVIVSFAAGLPDYDTAVARLLQNQADIGNAVKPFYGSAAGDRLTALLRQHILIAADILQAAKAGDTGAFNAARARWYANADQIAAFLHNANPGQWPLADMRTMMHRHLDLTLQEASARLTGEWAADVTAYDAVHLEILDMADMLSRGIIAQFPTRFR